MRSQRIAKLLPDVFQAALEAPATGGEMHDRRMGALLAAMEELHAPTEAVLDHLAEHVNPLTAPAGMVTYLAGWVDLDRMTRRGPGTPGPLDGAPDRLRLLVAAGSEISRWRGTAKGIVEILEIATGIRGFAVEENVSGDRPERRDFHVRVVAPSAAEPQRTLIEDIVRAEKPAHVTYEVAFPTRSANPTAGADDQEVEP